MDSAVGSDGTSEGHSGTTEKTEHVRMNGDLQSTTTKDTSESPIGEKENITGSITESNDTLVNGIDKCDLVELPDLCDNVISEVNENLSNSGNELKQKTYLIGDSDNFSETSESGKASDEVKTLNRNANEVEEMDTKSSKQDNSNTENGDIKATSERTDNIFEKFHQNIGKDNGCENASKSENERDAESQKDILNLQIKGRESLKGLIKAAASKIESQQGSPCTSGIHSGDDSNGTLAEQCGDITSTSKVDPAVSVNPDKGNLFENLAKVESPIKGSFSETLASQENSSDASKSMEEQCSSLKEPQNSLTEVSSKCPDTGITKLCEPSSIPMKDKTETRTLDAENDPLIQRECVKNVESDENLLNNKGLSEDDINDIDDSILDKTDEKHEIVSQNGQSNTIEPHNTDATQADVQECSNTNVIKEKESYNLSDDDMSTEITMETEESAIKEPGTKPEEESLISTKSLTEPVSANEDESQIDIDNQPSETENNTNTEPIKIDENISQSNLDNNQFSKTETNMKSEDPEVSNGAADAKEEINCNPEDTMDTCDNALDLNFEDRKNVENMDIEKSSVQCKEYALVKNKTKIDSDETKISKVTENNKDENGITVSNTDETDINQITKCDTDRTERKENVEDETVKIVDSLKDPEVKVEETTSILHKETDLHDDKASIEICTKMEIDNSEEIKLKMECEEDNSDSKIPQNEASENICSKMDTESVLDVKPKTEDKVKAIKTDENIPAEPRKRAAPSPVKEEGTVKKSRLENVVGGLMSRLGKDIHSMKDEISLSEEVSSGSESESALPDGPCIKISVKKINSLMKKHLKAAIENHRSSNKILQLQNKLVTLQAHVDTWKSTAQGLAEQVLELTKSKRHDKKKANGRIRTRSTSQQGDEAQIKAKAQGLVSSVKLPNGVVSPSNSPTVTAGNQVVSPTCNGPLTSLQSKKLAQEKRSNLTVREMLDEQRGGVPSKSSGHQTTTTSGATATSQAGEGGGGSSMVVDLTEDDDLNSPPKAAASGNARMLTPHVSGMTTGGLRPIIPAAALPPGIRPGTYLLQQNPGGGTVLQQLVSSSQVHPQQGHTVVIGTQGGPAILLQSPATVTTAGNHSNMLRQAVPTAKQRGNNLLVRHPQVGSTRPPPPLQTAAPMQQVQISRPPLSPNKKTTARKRTTPAVRGKKKSQKTQEDSSPDCDIMITTVTKPAPAKCHPAPLPPQPTSQASGNGMKLLPPKPTLKISRVSQGIVLSWNMMNLSAQFEEILNYQLFAYQEGSALPSALLWKKVGDVKALPLPMACTLTQFQEGNRYHFAVRAMDKHQRVGAFSDPSSIHLASSGKS